MLNQYINILGEQVIEVSLKVIKFLPQFIIGVIILLIGWLFGLILGRAVAHIFEILKINHFFNKIGFGHISNKTGHDLSIGIFFSAIVKWTIVIAFSLAAANIFGLSYVSLFLLSILSYLPSVFIAAFILVISLVLGNFIEKLIDGTVRTAGLKAKFTGTIARYAIVFTGILAALNQLDIITLFTNTIFIGIVSALSLAFGLAFGLGGKEAASRAIEKLEKDFKKD